MANEAVQVLRMSDPIDWIVIDADQVEKGTIMMISGSSTVGRTALSGSGVAPPFAGIARREKISDDGRSRLSMFYDGIFRLVSSAVIRAGDAVIISGNNMVASLRLSELSGQSIENGMIVGKALEDFTNGQTKEVMVGKI